MAWFTYKCRNCGVFRLSLPKRQLRAACPKCSTDSPASLKSGSVQVMEVLDNGLMERKVERLHNIEEMTAEIDKQDTERRKDPLEPEDA